MPRVLDRDELYEVVDTINNMVFEANREGKLEELLKSWNLDHLISQRSPFYDTERDGKIILIGYTNIKRKDLHGIVNALGLDKERFEFITESDDIKTYNYKKLQYNPKYRLVLVGPMPHSTAGKGNNSSTITNLENSDGYPRVVRLTNGNDLKITKSSLKKVLQELINKNYI